jgi:hypothetical protein
MRLIPTLLAASLLASPAFAASTNIHVTVTDDGPGQDVDVTLPFAVAQAALSMTPVQKQLDAGTIRLNDTDIKISDLRRMWAALRKTGDGDLVNVVDGSDKVRVFTRGGRFLVNVSEAGHDTVKVDVPGAVVDALLSGDGDRLDVGAAIEKLKDCAAGEIVRVDDGGSHVRVRLE